MSQGRRRSRELFGKVRVNAVFFGISGFGVGFPASKIGTSRIVTNMCNHVSLRVAVTIRARQKGDSKREKPDPERRFSQIFADFR